MSEAVGSMPSFTRNGVPRSSLARSSFSEMTSTALAVSSCTWRSTSIRKTVIDPVQLQRMVSESEITAVYHRDNDGLEFDRMAFFTDAVYAIAMTLLIVAIAVPAVHPSTSN